MLSDYNEFADRQKNDNEEVLGSEDAKNLKMLTTWITQVYLPMFYEVKLKHEIKQSPWHLVKLFRLWNQQDETIKDPS